MSIDILQTNNRTGRLLFFYTAFSGNPSDPAFQLFMCSIVIKLKYMRIARKSKLYWETSLWYFIIFNIKKKLKKTTAAHKVDESGPTITAKEVRAGVQLVKEDVSGVAQMTLVQISGCSRHWRGLIHYTGTLPEVYRS